MTSYLSISLIPFFSGLLLVPAGRAPTPYPEQQKIIASEVLWNLLVKDGETQEVRYRSFYEVLAKAPKNAPLENMLALSSSNRIEPSPS
jgi:hypothetical protein